VAGGLDGKLAFVTGGATGIGRATVLRFLGEGARVVAADLNEANAKAQVDEAADQGGDDRLRVVRADVSCEADVEAAMAEAVGAFGRLDVVCNNAGVAARSGRSPRSTSTTGTTPSACCSPASSWASSTAPAACRPRARAGRSSTPPRSPASRAAPGRTPTRRARRR